jgi:AMIN domain
VYGDRLPAYLRRQVIDESINPGAPGLDFRGLGASDTSPASTPGHPKPKRGTPAQHIYRLSQLVLRLLVRIPRARTARLCVELMPRLAHFGALLVVAASLSIPIAAQKSVPAVARVQHVVVRGTGDAMEVEIQTSGTAVAPDTQAITGPDRIVVDFPGALPAAELRALKVNRGPLKAVRAGLFFSNPPITRVVLDLTEPQSYQISTIKNAIVVKLGSAKEPSTQSRSVASRTEAPRATAPMARLQTAALATGNPTAAIQMATPKISDAVASTLEMPQPAAEPPAAPKPAVTVTFENGLLRIRAEKATLAQVLFEVHRQTQAEIAIPAGAEQEEVFADLGPAPSRDVLASLLNGSSYNFIFVGTEMRLEQVLLSRRDSNPY